MTSVELLKEECRMHNAQFADIDLEYPRFYEALNAIIMKPPHENLEQVCGLIFSKAFCITTGVLKLPSVYGSPGESLHSGPVISGGEALSASSSISDGETIFELYEQLENKAELKKSMLIFDALLDQKQLLSISMFRFNIVIIKRTDYLRIYYKGTIYVIENRLWKIYRPIDDYIIRMQKHYRDLNIIQYRDILSFAFYELSLNKIGASIVYLLNSGREIPNTIKNVKTDMDFNDIRQRRLLKNILRYNDGAISININNRIIETNVFLKFGANADKYVKNYSGTRHTSAAKYSFENSESIIVAVSADGPVSIFSEGHNVDKIMVDFNFEVNDKKNKKEDTEKESKSEELVKNCGKCGKTYLINAVTASGWREKETLVCSVCGHEYFSKSCFSLDHQLIKTVKRS